MQNAEAKILFSKTSNKMSESDKYIFGHKIYKKAKLHMWNLNYKKKMLWYANKSFTTHSWKIGGVNKTLNMFKEEFVQRFSHAKISFEHCCLDKSCSMPRIRING